MFDRLRSAFLRPYENARLEVRKKAGMMLAMSVIGIGLLIVGSLGINVLIVGNLRSALLEGLVAGGLVVGLVLLRRGHFETSSNVAIFSVFAGMAVAGFNGYSGDALTDGALLCCNLLPASLLVCLVGTRDFQPLLIMALSVATNVLYFVVSFRLVPGRALVPGPAALLLNTVLATLFAGATAWFVMRVHHELIEFAEEETRRLGARTRELEATRTAAEAEREWLAVTLRSIGDAVITTDAEGRITLINPIAEALTGYAAADALGRPLGEVFRLVHEETREPLENPMETVRRTGSRTGAERGAVLLDRSDRVRDISDSAAPIRDREGGIMGLVLVFRDVSQQRRAQERMQNEQRLSALGVLAGGIAHDFNNLLSGIFGYIELARADPALPPRVGQTLDRALGVFGRAQDLTRQLLTFAKGGHPVRRTLALGPLVRRSCQFALSGSSCEGVFELPEDLWSCEADENQLAQVIDNIVLNARQSMPKGGRITVSAENVPAGEPVPAPLRPGDYVHLSFRDQGVGIARAHLAHIFDPFFTTKQEGSGLGLATSHSIVQRHNGHLSAESELGHGSVFHVWLPAKRSGRVAVSKPSPPVPVGLGRVLLMDDEEFNLDVGARMLRALGYEAATARDGAEALERFREAADAGKPFDAVILDLTIPGGMGGRETLEALRRLDPQVRALVSSGYSADPSLAEPEGHGFCGRLPKPYGLSDLAQALEQALVRDPGEPKR